MGFSVSPSATHVYRFKLKPSGSSDPDPFRAICRPFACLAVQDATGRRFWLRRKTPDDSVVATGDLPGFTSTTRLALMAVMSSVGNAAGLNAKAGTGGSWVVFTMASATTVLLSFPPFIQLLSGHDEVENGGGGSSAAQTCCCRHSGALPLTAEPTQ